MFRSKLKKLHNFVKNQVEDEWFDLGSWSNDPQKFKAKSCGTTACLFGWAVPVFPKQLKWATPKEAKFYGMDIISHTPAKDRDDLIFDEFKLAAKIFGLAEIQSHFLFAPTYYPILQRTRKDVLERLKWFYEKAPDDFVIFDWEAKKRITPQRDMEMKTICTAKN